MSSFKRKGSAKQSSALVGTRRSSSSLSTILTSTGIPSLDDLLGGGLPLSCSQLILAPDSHSAYGELVQKYFIAQGLACGQKVCIIDDDALRLVSECMWIASSSLSTSVPSALDDDDSTSGDKIRIAWRYEQMKKFQTTVESTNSSSNEYCRTFDLTSRIPQSTVDDALSSEQLVCIRVDAPLPPASTSSRVISQITELLAASIVGTASSTPIRICIPSLGSPQWGDLTNTNILHLLFSVRRLVRQHPHACASLCLAPHLSTEVWGGPGWTDKLGWLSDSAFNLSAFTANPALSAMFPSHHGLLHALSLPSPHTILSPSDKLSTLRGLSASSNLTGGTGENNLAFKCTRKKLIFETLHLDLDGGVGERRTTPSSNSLAMEAGTTTSYGSKDQKPKESLAALEVELEAKDGDAAAPSSSGFDAERNAASRKAKKAKKTVAFQSDRPVLYDF